ncbi:hypothetical protein ABH922_004973 [Rhodococcus sp. 27YEA15]|uniref:hypothetical protein n=1 Tax=Rhodococcus sp. 27YEA15 TaxID=3156259 RepID=UPI003C7CE710
MGVRERLSRDGPAPVSEARRLVRPVQPRKWVPLAGLSVVMIGAMPLYVQRQFGYPSADDGTVGGLSGFGQLERSDAAAVYWLVTLPVAYAVIATYLGRRGPRSEVRLRALRAAGCGVVLFVALVLAIVILPELQLLPGNLLIRGLAPLLAIAMGVMMWGAIDHDWTVFGTGAFALAASMVANLYNIESVILAQGVDVDYRYALVVNLAFPAVVLAIGAMATALRDRPIR